MNCDGDQNDAAYFLSKLLPIDSGKVYAAIGTLATETDNATYVGLGVNDASTFLAPANVGDMTLKGSADVYADTERTPACFSCTSSPVIALRSLTCYRLDRCRTVPR